jgi:hypothetical protein
MATKRKMIGAHVPRKVKTRAPRCRLAESAEMINRAYDERVARKYAHLVWVRHGFNG